MTRCPGPEENYSSRMPVSRPRKYLTVRFAFLDPRGPLKVPLISRPSATKIPSSFSAPSFSHPPLRHATSPLPLMDMVKMGNMNIVDKISSTTTWTPSPSLIFKSGTFLAQFLEFSSASLHKEVPGCREAESND